MLVSRMLRLLVQMLVEVRKPSRSFLLTNAVDHANPVVITFPVVLPAQVNVTTGLTANASHRRRKQDARFACTVPGCGSTFTRGSEEQKQPMIPKRQETTDWWWWRCEYFVWADLMIDATMPDSLASFSDHAAIP